MSDIVSDETFSYSEEDMDVENNASSNEENMEANVAISAILDDSEALEKQSEKSSGKQKAPRKKAVVNSKREERQLWKTLAKIQEDLFSLKRKGNQPNDEQAPKRVKI